MKTFGDLQQKVKDTSKEELERIVLDIAEVWLIERGATADSLLEVTSVQSWTLAGPQLIKITLTL